MYVRRVIFSLNRTLKTRKLVFQQLISNDHICEIKSIYSLGSNQLDDNKCKITLVMKFLESNFVFIISLNDSSQRASK